MSGPGRVLDLRPDPDADLGEVAAHLRAGGAVAYPTDTVYGLGGACSEEGVATVRSVKGRAGDKPLIALVASADDVAELGWTPKARELASLFWPGSVTLVLPDPLGIFPEGVRDPARGTVGVRVSPHPLAARLVRALGGPLTSTSLNRPGEEPVRSGHAARELLGEMAAESVWLLDGGTLPPSQPSTVIDCSRDEPVVLRDGAVPLERLRCALPEIHGQTD